MGELGRYLVGAVGGVLIVVGLFGMARVTMGRPAARPAVAALETLAWLVVIVTIGGMLVLVASRL